MSSLPAALLEGIVVTGAGAASDPELNPRALLRERKMSKFMGAQDRLALAAASAAAASAGLERDGPHLGPSAGLFLTVGWLPFEREDIDVLCAASCDAAGNFDLPRFFRESYESINPLITFRCLSNMPTYHASTNLGIQGPYVTSYAGTGQLYAALEEALWSLSTEDGREPPPGGVERALWGGVAYQRNFLVEHHLGRIPACAPPRALGDGAGVLVLEREASARARGAEVRARLVACSLSYLPRDPHETHEAGEAGEAPGAEERFSGVEVDDLGVASLPWALSRAIAARAGGEVRHEAQTHDGYRLASTWELA